MSLKYNLIQAGALWGREPFSSPTFYPQPLLNLCTLILYHTNALELPDHFIKQDALFCYPCVGALVGVGSKALLARPWMSVQHFSPLSPSASTVPCQAPLPLRNEYNNSSNYFGALVPSQCTASILSLNSHKKPISRCYNISSGRGKLRHREVK